MQTIFPRNQDLAHLYSLSLLGISLTLRCNLSVNYYMLFTEIWQGVSQKGDGSETSESLNLNAYLLYCYNHSRRSHYQNLQEKQFYERKRRASALGRVARIRVGGS